MSVRELVVVGSFGQNVREGIGRANLCAIVKLRTNGGERCRECDETANILIRILNTHSEGPMFVQVIGHSKLSCPCIRNSDAKALVLIVSNGQIGRYGPSAFTIGRQPAPSLSAEDLPLAALEVHKVEAQPIGMRIRALVYAGAIVAAEITLYETNNIVACKMIVDLETQTRELRRGPEFADASLWSVAVREPAKIGSNVALSVCRPKNIFEIDESSEFQNRVPESESTQRYLFWFAVALSLNG